jgi:hypothetical protein
MNTCPSGKAFIEPTEIVSEHITARFMTTALDEHLPVRSSPADFATDLAVSSNAAEIDIERFR